jgi:hypothetical protein
MLTPVIQVPHLDRLRPGKNFWADNRKPHSQASWQGAMLSLGFQGKGYVHTPRGSISLSNLCGCLLGGRPDVMKLVREAYYAWGAEVVFITSNYQGNKEIMEGCKSEGIPAFVSSFS